MDGSDEVARLLGEVRACTVCADLPEGPRPIVQFSAEARIVIIGQAPGRRVHASGIPWDDPSGTRLRDWLGVDEATFYDPTQLALIPMGFCFPGTGTSGDLPPRPECAPLWHDRLLGHLPEGRGEVLTILLGQYALARYAPGFSSVTAAVEAWPELLPDRIALPHPSPRNNRWLSRNPWFATATIPALRDRVARALDTT